MQPEEIIQSYNRLESERSVWDSHWQELAEFIQPRKAQIQNRSQTPREDLHARLFDSTGVQANLTLARGQLAWMTPKESPWFEFTPEEALAEEDEIQNWMSRCTQVAREFLANSNFYTEVHEVYLDRGAFGTGCLYVDWDAERQALQFRCYPVGTYVCSENASGMVDTVMVKRTWTARQAAQVFGDQLPEEIADQARDAKTWDKPSDYLHAVFPRESHAAPGGPGAQRPIASVWIHLSTKTIVEESGYDEMPFFVTRFLRWPRITESLSPYGWSPAWAALPDLRQLNHLESTLDALADRQVNPPILMPDGLDTRADLRPGGITLFDQTRGVPQEWLTQGRYDIGQMRAEEKRNRVRNAFMVGLFEMFAQLHDRMTATEVNARMQEKIDQFSPTFDLLSSELLTPLLRRIFSLLLQHNALPEPVPQGIFDLDPETGTLSMLEPCIRFNSRIALAISAAQDQGALRSMDMIAPLVQMKPELMENFDLDHLVRDLFRHNGAPPEWLRSEEEIEAEREAAQQAVAMESALASMAAGPPAEGAPALPPMAMP